MVREDGREGDVVLADRAEATYDAPWKDIEAQGWIARPPTASRCGVTLTDAERMAYATAEPEERYKLAPTAGPSTRW